MAEQMQFIYVLKVTRLEQLTEGPTEQEEAVVAEHFAYLKDLSQRGIALLVGRTQTADTETFGLVVLQVPSEEEARQVMADDPSVKHGVMTAKLYPFRIALGLGA